MPNIEERRLLRMKAYLSTMRIMMNLILYYIRHDKMTSEQIYRLEASLRSAKILTTIQITNMANENDLELD